METTTQPTKRALEETAVPKKKRKKRKKGKKRNENDVVCFRLLPLTCRLTATLLSISTMANTKYL